MKLSKQTIYIAPESTNKSRHITAPKPVRGMKPRTPGLVMHLFYKILFMTYFFLSVLYLKMVYLESEAIKNADFPIHKSGIIITRKPVARDLTDVLSLSLFHHLEILV